MAVLAEVPPDEPDVEVGVIVIVPVKGLLIGSSAASVVASSDTKICSTEPDSATPLVVRLGGRPLWFTRSHTGALLPPDPAPVALPAVTVNGMTLPLEDTSISSGADTAPPVT